jgi:hypothetical protein
VRWRRDATLSGRAEPSAPGLRASSIGRGTREQVQTAGSGLRKGLQRRAFRSIWVVAELIQCAAHDAEMDSADNFRILVGRLEERATPKLDHSGVSIRPRIEPELSQQGDHLSARGCRLLWAMCAANADARPA